ncbi:hypothetical protein BCR34DRAFT_490154 [Clohesyomyces aquaticus]|uniref:NAD(P)-binding protein n=1 Tax=Clohesyomyces aquaticus TaxID=1231657 RepID=A0A1Y1Z886_9PLEO|nr:hypothetical protein BCR34DRAFT_490154 [Clohesyomyces aquaticus]
MPLHILAQGVFEGISTLPGGWTLLKTIIALAVLLVLKRFFNGAWNTSERNMHSKVVMITGGTSGIGAEVARNLAQRGAQLILLTNHPLSDPFLVDYIFDLRSSTNNELITAEHVDLASLHSIRLFATKWIDNAPPRRLDMIVLCANEMTPPGGKIRVTEDGVERIWGVNYLANFHLLSILSPGLRAQPPDRDVRVVIATCGSYIVGKLPESSGPTSEKNGKGKKNTGRDIKAAPMPETFNPSAAYADSKLALMTFAHAFQKHLTSYIRPDKSPNNARVILCDPGLTRTPGMRRYLSRGSILGLLVYLFMWPFWWLVLKSPDSGAQTILFAAMEAEFGRGEGGVFLKEVQVRELARKEEIGDEGCQKSLWEESERVVQGLEKEGAGRRAREKKEREARDKKVEKEKEREAAKEKDKPQSTADGARQRKGK